MRNLEDSVELNMRLSFLIKLCVLPNRVHYIFYKLSEMSDLTNATVAASLDVINNQLSELATVAI